MDDDFPIKEGSSNVSADLGLPDPEERLAKAELAMQIANGIRARRLTQARAAALFGVDQPKISRLLRRHVSGFSTDRLIHLLTLLGQDVFIVVKPAIRHSHGPGHVRVVAEADLAGWQETLHLLSSPKNAKLLMESVRQARSGETQEQALAVPSAQPTGTFTA